MGISDGSWMVSIQRGYEDAFYIPHVACKTPRRRTAPTLFIIHDSGPFFLLSSVQGSKPFSPLKMLFMVCFFSFFLSFLFLLTNATFRLGDKVPA